MGMGDIGDVRDRQLGAPRGRCFVGGCNRPCRSLGRVFWRRAVGEVEGG